MAYVPRKARGITSLARGIHSFPNFFISFARPNSLYREEYVCMCMYTYTHTHTHTHTHIYIYIYIHTHTHLTAYRLYMNYRCYQITLQWNIWTQIGSGAKCWLDIYHWGVGLAVNGRIRDIRQNVLQSSFPTESSSSHSYFHIFLLIAFLEEVFIRNIIYYRLIYIIIVKWSNNDNNATINNYLWKPPYSICVFLFA
jgi:hypothetical protein